MQSNKPEKELSGVAVLVHECNQITHWDAPAVSKLATLCNRVISELDLTKVKAAVLQHETKTLLKNYDKMRAGWLQSSDAKTGD